MKTMKYITSLLCCASLLMACSSEEEIKESETKVPLEVTVSGGNESRSVIEGTTIPPQTSFGIYGVNSNFSITNSLDNISVFYDGNCKLAKDVYLNNTSIFVRAYYPYSSDTKNGMASIDIRKQVDFLYGSAVMSDGKLQEINRSNPKASIVFQHALSRITFKVKHTDAYGDDFKLSSIFISNIYVTATFDILKQELKPVLPNEPTFDINVTVGKEFSTFDLLMIPADAHSVGIILYDSNIKGQWVKLPEGVWKAGQQYTYEVTFDNNGIKISEAAITPWNTTIEQESEITDDNLVTN